MTQATGPSSPALIRIPGEPLGRGRLLTEAPASIWSFDSANFQATETRLTLQHISLVNGKTTPTDLIPAAPQAACSQGYDDGQGGALFMRDGNLTVIDAIFTGNQAAQLGPDTGGGAIYIERSKHGAVIVGSTFSNNSGANAGGRLARDNSARASGRARAARDKKILRGDVGTDLGDGFGDGASGPRRRGAAP